jgi:catechol 2,3-dioxygenase-like lactoylglutathione lyase family enzyme
MDHVGINVVDLDAAVEFFSILGFEIQGKAHMSGEFVESIIDLPHVDDDLVMMRTPDGSGAVELVQFHSPLDPAGPEISPANRLGIRHLCFEVEDLSGLLKALGDKGFEPMGQVRDYEDIWRMCYLRGPEGLIVELSERLQSSTKS